MANINLNRKCEPCHRDTPPLEHAQITTLLAQVDGWQWDTEKKCIHKKYLFKNYYTTMAFMNAVAWIAHCENHHPDCTVGYQSCHVFLKTHAIGGLSNNDFIVARQIDDLERNS
jgi:4a-hydroxytetrahydrobiopterin dehydratase